ncbi:hypothetical protein AZA_83468 [Nitrospirillum viridazoti Y2]|nr:hypothetical protein AZA_83468 [Nitrospirillum amazonense Y2]
MIAALGAVLDQPVPGPAGADGGPEVGEGCLGHVGMAHQVVRRADQFLMAESADADEGAVGVGDAARRVGTGDQQFPLAQLHLTAGHGPRVAHRVPPKLLSQAVSFAPTRSFGLVSSLAPERLTRRKGFSRLTKSSESSP